MSRKKIVVRGEVSDIIIEDGKTPIQRLFCVVPKKQFPTAVLRNKIKRWCRSAWRDTQLSKNSKSTTTVKLKKREASLTSITKDLKDAERSMLE